MSYSMKYCIEKANKDSRLKHILTCEPDCIKEFDSKYLMHIFHSYEDKYVFNSDGNIIYNGENNDSITAIISCCKDYDFNNMFFSTIRHDGTLLFSIESIRGMLDAAVIININIKEIKNGKIMHLIMGNIIFCSEYDEQLGTEEKPWMHSRETVMLPFKVWYE